MFPQGNEQVLTAALAYQAGPYGNFYLPNTTPLYGAGSCSPADAGLYHYTTRLDQVKEGEDTGKVNANIGLHYIAATNSQPSALNFQPVDTDGDGIPDYVENWHGDGNYSLHTDTETDWRTQYTTQDVWDPTNSIYDDIDLSGDGLVGRIKKALGMSPFDTSNPLTLTQVITGEEPDFISFEMPVSYNLITNIGGLNLNIDGVDAIFQQCTSAADGNCLIKWNSDYSSPGQHCIQAEMTLDDMIDSDSSTIAKVLSANGPLISFNSENILQFDPFYSEYNDSGAKLFAWLAVQHADYTIELQTPSGDHIKTITGTTSSGVISEDWNMEDDYGNKYAGNSVNAVFNVTPVDDLSMTMDNSSADASVQTLQQTLNKCGSIPNGKFVIAYAWNDGTAAQNQLWYCFEYGVVNPLISLPESGGSGSPNPYPCDFNKYTWSGDTKGDPGYLSTQTRANEMVNGFLTDAQTGNFYFYGHGSTTMIGDNNKPGVRIKSTAVASALNNNLGFMVNEHPYRFVFLDACDTAKHWSWAKSFGITPNITPEQADTSPDQVQAFLGWKNDAPLSGPDDYDTAKMYTYQVFFNAWMQGLNLVECVKLAQSPNLTWPLGAEPPDWFWPKWYPPPFYRQGHWCIYGYPWITRDFHTSP